MNARPSRIGEYCEGAGGSVPNLGELAMSHVLRRSPEVGTAGTGLVLAGGGPS